MSIGIQPSKADVDTFMTRISKRLSVGFEEVEQFKFWLDSKNEAYFTVLGYTAGEYAQIVSVFGDLNKLRQVWEGAMYVTNGGTPGTGVPTIGNGYDFRTFVKLLFGFGFDTQN